RRRRQRRYLHLVERCALPGSAGTGCARAGVHPAVPSGRPGQGTSGVGTFSVAEYRAYRDRAQTLDGVLAHSNPLETTLGGETPQQLFGVLVSCNYFAVMGQAPALGRGLTDEDCELGAPPVVVLGHSLWTRAFDADPDVLGRT